MLVRPFAPLLAGSAVSAVLVALWMKADNFCVGAYHDDTFGTPENPFGLISCDHFEYTIRDDISLALLVTP